MLPEATRASMWSSKSSQERKAGGRPDLGNISKTLMRVEPSLVSEPRQKGELVESATRSGTRPASALIGPDRGVSVGHGDVDVQAVDRLRPRDPAHLLLDAQVVDPARERLLRRLRERVGAGRDDLDPPAAREVAHLPAQPGQLAREVGGRSEDRGEHLDARARELGGDELRAVPGGEHLVHGRRQPARDGVDQLKLLLDTDRVRRRRAEPMHVSTPASQACQHASAFGLRLSARSG